MTNKETMLDIQTISVGPIETNCYIVSENDAAIVIDPGDEAENILKEIGSKKVEAIILTHLHFDHITAAQELKKKTGAKIYCHKTDLKILDENLLSKSDIDGFLNNELRIMNDEIQNHNSCFKIHNSILETPGHTPGGICLYLLEQKILFSGDTIFKGAIGAVHFRGGDFSAIEDSIEKKLLTLPDDTHVYPGHGANFILGEEKENIRSFLQ
jgi:glyoxylase-like metal-dependent hydrolase (beta-lactamase superfamily II)